VAGGGLGVAPLTLTLSPLRVEREPRSSLSRRERDGVRGPRVTLSIEWLS
jgi:hypothetical protein